MFYAHVQQCEAKLTEATAALVTLAEEVTALRAAGAQECEAAVAELLASTGQLQEAFEFVDVLAHNVRAATALIDATERRLDTLEAGLTLPRAIAQLPPVQFEAHQFAQQLQRRECATIPELPELSELASRAERAAQADAAELEQLSEYELKLEQMARDAAARATNLASALHEKARLYSGPGSFLQRNATWLSQQASAAVNEVDGALERGGWLADGASPPAAVPRRPSTPTELRLD